MVHPGRPATDSFIKRLTKQPVLGRVEERRLALLYRDTGDKSAARKLVEGHLRLVVKIARGCCVNGSTLPDLIQEGTLGLMKAVTKYDPDRGVRLSTYAGWWIRAYIYQYNMVNGRMVRVVTTLPQRKLFFGLRREQAKMNASGGAVEAGAVRQFKPSFRPIRKRERARHESRIVREAVTAATDEQRERVRRLARW